MVQLQTRTVVLDALSAEYDFSRAGSLFNLDEFLKLSCSYAYGIIYGLRKYVYRTDAFVMIIMSPEKLRMTQSAHQCFHEKVITIGQHIAAESLVDVGGAEIEHA